MSKTAKKALLCAVGAIVLLAAALFVYFLVMWENSKKVTFDYENTTTRIVLPWQDSGVMEANGYVINLPKFRSDPTNLAVDCVYDEINGLCQFYAGDVAAKYDNYAKLDYTVETVENDTLTVTFSGVGYPDGEGSEPEEVGTSFVFDIKDVGGGHFPKMIGGDMEFYERVQAIPQVQETQDSAAD